MRIVSLIICLFLLTYVNLQAQNCPRVFEQDDTLFTDPAYRIQWYQEMEVLPFETKEFFVPPKSGLYSVVAFDSSEVYVYKGESILSLNSQVVRDFMSNVLYKLPLDPTFTFEYVAGQSPALRESTANFGGGETKCKFSNSNISKQKFDSANNSNLFKNENPTQIQIPIEVGKVYFFEALVDESKAGFNGYKGMIYIKSISDEYFSFAGKEVETMYFDVKYIQF